MDDYLYNEDSIKLIVDEFKQNENKLWLVNSYYHTKNYKDFFRPYHPKNNKYLYLGKNTIGCPSSLTIRNTIVERFDEKIKYHMDCEFYHRLFKYYGDPIYLHKILIVNYLHSSQVSNTQINKNIINNELRYIVQKHGKKK